MVRFKDNKSFRERAHERNHRKRWGISYLRELKLPELKEKERSNSEFIFKDAPPSFKFTLIELDECLIHKVRIIFHNSIGFLKYKKTFSSLFSELNPQIAMFFYLKIIESRPVLFPTLSPQA